MSVKRKTSRGDVSNKKKSVRLQQKEIEKDLMCPISSLFSRRRVGGERSIMWSSLQSISPLPRPPWRGEAGKSDFFGAIFLLLLPSPSARITKHVEVASPSSISQGRERERETAMRRRRRWRQQCVIPWPILDPVLSSFSGHIREPILSVGQQGRRERESRFGPTLPPHPTSPPLLVPY